MQNPPLPANPAASGVERDSVVNADDLHTLRQRSLTDFVGAVDQATLARVCAAVHHALAC